MIAKNEIFLGRMEKELKLMGENIKRIDEKGGQKDDQKTKENPQVKATFH